MARIDRFEEMEVWKDSRMLVKQVYQLTSHLPFSKDYGLSGQIQRAAVSIASNIAEGFERRGNKEFVHFLYLAKGSAGEVRTQIYVANDLGYIGEDESLRLVEAVLSISRQLSGLIKYLSESESLKNSRSGSRCSEDLIIFESDNLQSQC